MEWFEVDLRDRETGDSVECIYSGEDHDEAYQIAEEYNKENLKDYGVEKCVEDYIGETENGLVADVYHCEREEQIHGVGKWE